MNNTFYGLYNIRDFRETDKAFVLSTFLRGLYYGDSWFSLIPKAIFMENYKKVAEHLVTSPNFIIKVACLTDDMDTILGYSILSADFQTIHFVYVKSSKMTDGSTWRNKGIGKSLVPQRPVAVSHLTKLGLQLLKSKFPNTIFNPFAI